MKKIYSFVLMAAMLLVGTSAWAQLNVATVTGAGAGNYKSLQEAVNAIPAGQTATITLLRNVTLSAPVVIPQVTGDVTEAQKVVNREMQHITLDLGEFNISASQSYYGSAFILLLCRCCSAAILFCCDSVLRRFCYLYSALYVLRG